MWLSSFIINFVYILTFIYKLFFSGSIRVCLGFPGGSYGKESAYNPGEEGLIPGSGRYPGGGHGNPLQNSCLENPVDGGGWQAPVHGVAELDMTEWLTLSKVCLKQWAFEFLISSVYFFCKQKLYSKVQYIKSIKARLIWLRGGVGTWNPTNLGGPSQRPSIIIWSTEEHSLEMTLLPLFISLMCVCMLYSRY